MTEAAHQADAGPAYAVWLYSGEVVRFQENQPENPGLSLVTSADGRIWLVTSIDLVPLAASGLH